MRINYLLFYQCLASSRWVFRLLAVVVWYNSGMSAVVAQLAHPRPASIPSENMQQLRGQIIQLVRVQDFQGLIQTGKAGMQLASLTRNDTARSWFSYYTGAGFEYSNQLDSDIHYYELSEGIARQSHDWNRQVSAQIRLAALYVMTGNKQKTDRIVPGIETLAVRAGDAKTLSAAHSLLGAYYSQEHSYEKAVAHLLKSLAYVQARRDSANIGITLSNIGNNYWEAGQYPKSLAYSLEALLYLGRYPHELANSYSNLGSIYQDLHRPDSALHYYLRSVRLARQIKALDILAYVYTDLGRLYSALDKYDQARRYLLMARPLADSLYHQLSSIQIDTRLGELAHREGRYGVAKGYLENALQRALPLGNKASLQEIYQNLALTEGSLGHYRQAYEYQRLHARYQDSLATESSSRNIAEMETRYQTERRQQQISLLKEQNLVQSLQLGVRRRNELLLLLGIGALVLAGGLGYRRYRRRNRLAMERVRSGIAADFHDELGANLSSIALYSDILLQHAGVQSDKAVPLLASINQNARQTLSAINDLIWTVKPDNDALERTLVRMKEFAIPLAEAKKMAFDFHVALDLPQARLDMTVRKILYLVFKEAVNNALKYSEATKVSVRLSRKAGNICLEIADNGKGFDPGSVHPGNGLGNMRKRAAEIGGALTIDTQPGQGCTLRLVFKPA